MTCAAILSELGDIALRGNASVQNRKIKLARPYNEAAIITIDLTNWLNGATLSSRTVSEHGSDITDNGVSSNVWSLTITQDGWCELLATASDGRKWAGVLEMVDTSSAPWRDLYH